MVWDYKKFTEDRLGEEMAKKAAVVNPIAPINLNPANRVMPSGVSITNTRKTPPVWEDIKKVAGIGAEQAKWVAGALYNPLAKGAEYLTGIPQWKVPTTPVSPAVPNITGTVEPPVSPATTPSKIDTSGYIKNTNPAYPSAQWYNPKTDNYINVYTDPATGQEREMASNWGVTGTDKKYLAAHNIAVPRGARTGVGGIGAKALTPLEASITAGDRVRAMYNVRHEKGALAAKIADIAGRAALSSEDRKFMEDYDATYGKQREPTTSENRYSRNISDIQGTIQDTEGTRVFYRSPLPAANAVLPPSGTLARYNITNPLLTDEQADKMEADEARHAKLQGAISGIDPNVALHHYPVEILRPDEISRIDKEVPVYSADGKQIGTKTVPDYAARVKARLEEETQADLRIKNLVEAGLTKAQAASYLATAKKTGIEAGGKLTNKDAMTMATVEEPILDVDGNPTGKVRRYVDPVLYKQYKSGDFKKPAEKVRSIHSLIDFFKRNAGEQTYQQMYDSAKGQGWTDEEINTAWPKASGNTRKPLSAFGG